MLSTKMMIIFQKKKHEYDEHAMYTLEAKQECLNNDSITYLVEVPVHDHGKPEGGSGWSADHV